MIKLKSIILENNNRINTFKRELKDFIKRYRESPEGYEKTHLMKLIKIAREEIEKEKKKPSSQREYEFNRTNFLNHQYTGYIGMDAYGQYKTEQGLEWLGKSSRYPTLIEKKKHGSYEVEYRLRDDNTVVAFINGNAVGWASDEFGTVGVWVVEKYQRLGIGTELMHKHIEMRPDVKSGKNKIGQMTPAGQNLTMRYYDKYGKDWFDKKPLTESFELPTEINIKAEILTKTIASIFLKYFEKAISPSTNKIDKNIVIYNQFYKLTKQYYSEGTKLFNIIKTIEDTQWGMAHYKISSKDESFPDVILYITDGYPTATDGGMNIDDIQKMYILVDRNKFLQSFMESTEELMDTVKHEIRHWYQMSNNLKGLPKVGIRSKKFDPYGYGKGVERSPHHMRDIEFKTNLHSTKFLMERYFNKNIPEKDWKKEFKKMVIGNKFYTDDDSLTHSLESLDDMRKKDRPRWEQFVKELYKLIFPYD